MGDIAEHQFVGVAPIDTSDHGAVRFPIGIELVAQGGDALGSPLGQLLVSCFLFILLLVHFLGLPWRLTGRGAVEKADRNSSGTTRSSSAGNEQGSLKHPLRSNEIDVEGGTEGIAVPTRAIHFPSSLGKKCVVDGHHRRQLARQMGARLARHALEQDRRVYPSLREEAVRSRPISKLLSTGTQKASNRLSAQATKGSQGQEVGALVRALLVKSPTQVREVLLEVREEATGR